MKIILFLIAITLTAHLFYNKGVKSVKKYEKKCTKNEKQSKLIPDLIKSKTGKTVKVLRDKKGHFVKKPKA